MSFNLDAIKAKLEQLNTQGSRQTWKPKEGEQIIRIVPPQHTDNGALLPDTPFHELYFHYEVTDKSTLSPKTYGNPDPICELADILKAEGGDSWDEGKKIDAKLRTYVPIIVRGKEDEGVKYWGFGVQIYKALMEIMTDPDWGDITDLTNGRDIKVTFIPKEKSDTNFPKTLIIMKPTQVPATTDKKVADMIMNKQAKIEDVFPEPSYEELKDQLSKWSDPESADSDVPAQKAATPAASKTPEPTSTTDIEAEMENVFEQLAKKKQ